MCASSWFRDERDAGLEEGGRSAQQQRPPAITDVTQTDGQQGTRSKNQTDSHSKLLAAEVDFSDGASRRRATELTMAPMVAASLRAGMHTATDVAGERFAPNIRSIGIDRSTSLNRGAVDGMEGPHAGTATSFPVLFVNALAVAGWRRWWGRGPRSTGPGGDRAPP